MTMTLVTINTDNNTTMDYNNNGNYGNDDEYNVHLNDVKKMNDDNIQITPCVEDQIDVGSDQILSSPHVSEGPGRIAKAPIPSIYLDDRGDIHRLRVGGTRINLLYSKQNTMRSGYFHPHITYDFIVNGTIEVWTLNKTGTLKTIYKSHDYFVINPYIPHILYFLDDTILMEWYDKNCEFQCYYYHPYRKIVDIQNSIIATSTSKSNNDINRNKMGRLSRLIVQDDMDANDQLTNKNGNNSNDNNSKNKLYSSSSSSSSWINSLSTFICSTTVLMTSSSIALISGIAIGILLNERHNQKINKINKN